MKYTLTHIETPGQCDNHLHRPLPILKAIDHDMISSVNLKLIPILEMRVVGQHLVRGILL